MQPKDVQQEVQTAIRVGATPDLAAELAGLSSGEFIRWMALGASEDEEHAPFREFREAVESAENEAEAMLLARVQEAARKGNVRAATWLLERRWPHNWDKNSEEDVSDSSTSFDQLDSETDRPNLRAVE